jgi:putative FmdB family regulatory protein
MPLYEYQCEDCQLVFDELRKADDREAPLECPKCGGGGRVLISGFAQGSGTHADTPCGSPPPPGGCNPGST